jgi:hypothetical protein
MVLFFVKGIQMVKHVRIGNIPKTEAGRGLVSVFSVLLCLTACSFAQENEHETLNRLYREIIGSAPAGITIGMDSVRHAVGAGSSVQSAAADTPRIILPTGALADPVNEQLRTEIEKLVQEAGTRHNGAMKFMQESR